MGSKCQGGGDVKFLVLHKEGGGAKGSQPSRDGVAIKG